MAFTRKFSGETLPDKVVVVTGPTLGTILGFIGLGVVLGAAAALYFRNSQEVAAESEELAADGSHRVEGLVERLNRLQGRIKTLAGRTRETVTHAKDVLGPVLHEAVNEAKNAARDAEEELQAEIDKPRPRSAELDPDEAKGAGDPAI